MKPLDSKDFRSSRLVLEPDDFALGPSEPDPPPSDLIERDTWESMVSLPDDVSIRTSNEYGKVLKALWFYWGQWICLVGALRQGSATSAPCPVAHVASDVSDELQASIFCSLAGYYRVAFSCLRNVIEQMTVALQLEVSGDVALFQSWLEGEKELKLGWAADLLPQNANVFALESRWKATANDDLFSQKGHGSSGGGFVRRLFSELSKFTHGAPGFTDFDLRESTGPIFVRETYERWLVKFRQVYAIGILEAQVARPSTGSLAYDSEHTAGSLFATVLAELPVDIDGRGLLASAPADLWAGGADR